VFAADLLLACAMPPSSQELPSCNRRAEDTSCIVLCLCLLCSLLGVQTGMIAEKDLKNWNFVLIIFIKQKWSHAHQE